MTVKIAAYPKCYEYEIGLHHTMSVFDWIKLAGEHLAVDGLEMYERFFSRLEHSFLKQVTEAAQEAGFEIPMLICSPDFTSPDPDERNKAVDYQIKMIEVAAILGGEGTICRILSGQQHDGVTREQGIAWVVEAIEHVLPVAQQYGVILGMENHYKDSQWTHPEFALKADVFLEILNKIDEDAHFGVQYDPSNAIVAGDDPIALLHAVKDRVVSMHASDRYFKDDVTPEQMTADAGTMGYAPYLQHGIVGKGLNDYDQIMRILSESSFRGWISIEDGLNGIEEMQQSVQFLRDMIDVYFLDRNEEQGKQEVE